MTSFEVVSWFLVFFATDDVIAAAETNKTNFKESEGMPVVCYSGALQESAPRYKCLCDAFHLKEVFNE